MTLSYTFNIQLDENGAGPFLNAATVTQVGQNVLSEYGRLNSSMV